MTDVPKCASCMGSGEMPSDYGSVDCPDCGGAGYLPSHHVLVEWRARDIERSLGRRDPSDAADLAFTLAELGRARAALLEIVALAHDVDDDDAIGRRIRFVANRALGLYAVGAATEGEIEGDAAR